MAASQAAARKRAGRNESLCTLRYSATHVDKHHMVFRLDAVDAYERKLVKQIEVAEMQAESAHNRAFVKFVSATNVRGAVRARVELDMLEGAHVRRKEVTVDDGDDLGEITNREVYANCRIGEISRRTKQSASGNSTAGRRAIFAAGRSDRRRQCR